MSVAKKKKAAGRSRQTSAQFQASCEMHPLFVTCIFALLALGFGDSYFTANVAANVAPHLHERLDLHLSGIWTTYRCVGCCCLGLQVSCCCGSYPNQILLCAAFIPLLAVQPDTHTFGPHTHKHLQNGRARRPVWPTWQLSCVIVANYHLRWPLKMRFAEGIEMQSQQVGDPTHNKETYS